MNLQLLTYSEYKQMSKLQCSLHSLPFSLYCNHCLEPVCNKCSIIGPHNTSLHSLSPLPQSYEHRVQQMNTRITALINSRDSILSHTSTLMHSIQAIKLLHQQIEFQNSRSQSSILSSLRKVFENVIAQKSREQDNLYQQLNNINDLGHEFQTISCQSDILCLVNSKKIMDELKQVCDKVEILLTVEGEKSNGEELPKQLTQIREGLRKIETFEQLYKQKEQVLKALIKKLYKELAAIQAPDIDYQKYLSELNYHLKMFEAQKVENKQLQKRKCHYICHFCGIIMDNETINTACKKNQINQQIKTTEKSFSLKNAAIQGYCKNEPETMRFGTHRHYFGEPADPNKFYRIAFINSMMGKQSLFFLLSFLPKSQEQLREINYSISSEGNTFSHYLEAIFLKIKTLCKIKKINLAALFKKEDLKVKLKPSDDQEQKQFNGFCELIAMQYIFMEVVGLSESETAVMTEISENSDIKDEVRNYGKILGKLDMMIDI